MYCTLTFVFQSGDSPEVALVEADKPLELRERWKVVDKMEMITQYTFAGDFTRTSNSFILRRIHLGPS